MKSFGQKIRSIRETKNLLLREVAAAIEIDQALLSKIERSERIATKKQVLALSDFFGIDTKKLLSLWLGEKIADEIEDEEVAHDALRVAEETIKYRINRKEKNYMYNESSESPSVNEPLGLFPDDVRNF